MSAITTHVLDTATGLPARGMGVRLERWTTDGWEPLASRATDSDGRVGDLLPPGEPLRTGAYRLTFETGLYRARQGAVAFYPEVSVTFDVDDPSRHHHVPLLLSPYAYTTYRGS